MEKSIVCSRYGPSEARLFRFLADPACEMVRIPEEVIGKCHALCPSLFPQCRLFGLAPEIVVWKNFKLGEIQTFRETPLHVRRHFPQAMFGCIIGQNNPEKDCPLTAPVFPDLMPNMNDIGTERGFDGA